MAQSTDTPFSTARLLPMLRALSALAATPEGRRIVAERLDACVRQSKIGGPLLEKLSLMATYFRDPAEPLPPKLMIGAALLYLIIPTDLIPDFAPIIGLTDDVAAIGIVWNLTRDVLMNYQQRRQARLAVEEAA